MRTEQEMFDLILNIAAEDERIRAVYMNGSRTNPNVPKDIFQDYDIVYVVTETESFREDEAWIDRFGERLYMQSPEKNDTMMGIDVDIENSYGWLMQFADGNRIDLHVQTVAFAKKHILDDKLCMILMDKDHILPEIPQSTDEDYFVKRPTKEEVFCTCNEFWWCLNNVAKGLWREEIPYVQDMINFYIRPELVKVLAWKVGIETDFSCSIGKSGKYMDRWLTKEVWEAFLKTYASGEIEEIWKAVAVMCDLFDTVSREVCEALDFVYNTKEAEASRGFLDHVHALPKDATEIYEIK